MTLVENCLFIGSEDGPIFEERHDASGNSVLVVRDSVLVRKEEAVRRGWLTMEEVFPE